MLGKAKIKYIQSLGQKKHREEEGLFIAEGPKIIHELLHSVPQHVQDVYAVKEWLKENANHPHQHSFHEVSDAELERLSQLKTPNEVIAVVTKFDNAKTIATKGKISLLLDTLQDPGNFGTIIRTADWFGLSQVICSEDCADIYNPKVVQATMGSIARVNVFYTDLVKWLEQQNEVPIYVTMLEGKDVTEMAPLNEGIIVFGNESKGIHQEIVQLANERITVRGKGKAESLNAAVAVGIVLSHIA
ncbi:MAG: TrmH family RNA methyltransferase [Chitinophagales bacterium]